MHLSGLMQCLIVHIVLLTGYMVRSQSATQPLLKFCNVSSYVAYSPRKSGVIVSPNFPSSVPRTGGSLLSCELNITACAHCRIRLNFDGLQKSWLTRCKSSIRDGSIGCHPGCNHLLVYEPGYYEKTYEYITAAYMPWHYESSIRELTLRYCQSADDGVPRNFSFTYDVLEKEVRTFIGHTEEIHGVPAVVGQFSSFGFPHAYSSSGDIFTYYLCNEDQSGHVRLTFEDWNLSPYSNIMIYEGKNWIGNSGPVIHATGASSRPFVVSAGSNITVRFRTGTNIGASFIGFRASYYFVSNTDWVDKPTVVDEFYLSSKFGGELSSGSQCTVHSRMDYLWVIPHSSLIGDDYSLLLQLKRTKFSSAGDLLEIRRGNNSKGELVPWTQHAVLNDSLGFYIRLRMICVPGNSFAATYVWTRSSQVDGCRTDREFLCVERQYCIPSSLRCDLIDHCGDGSDETSCSEVSASPIFQSRATTDSQCSGYFLCHSGEVICMHQRCDDKVDCQDMTDERSCYDDDQYQSYVALGIIIPIVLICVMAFLIVCAMVGFLVRARRRRAALIHSRLYRQHQAALHAAGHFDDTVPYGCEARLLDGSLPNAEEPPSYGDCIQNESLNDASRQIIRPPSYQSTGEPESSAKYAAVGQQDADCQVPPPAYSSQLDGGK